MLAENFRSIPSRTEGMRQLMSDPVLLDAIVCLRDEVTEMLRGETSTTPESSLNFVKGFNNCIDTFMELAVPMPTIPEEPEPTWGVAQEGFPNPHK